MKQIRKYRNELTVLLLAFFIAGGFQFPYMESLHFLSHADDLLSGTHHPHRFHNHTESHDHRDLKVLEGLEKSSSDQPAPASQSNDQETVKTPQHIGNTPACTGFFLQSALLNMLPVNRLYSCQLPVPVPPPRESALSQLLLPNVRPHLA